MKTNIFWFRHDLRLNDNHGLYLALGAGHVLPIFIFDPRILDNLEDRSDRRVNFIHARLVQMDARLREMGSCLRVYHGTAEEVFGHLVKQHQLDRVYANEDYEPYARQRDDAVGQLLQGFGIGFNLSQDSVIRGPEDVKTGQNKPYAVFTPYSRRWLDLLREQDLLSFECGAGFDAFVPVVNGEAMPSLEELGFRKAEHPTVEVDYTAFDPTDYGVVRDQMALDATSRFGIHLRFGTISIRALVRHAREFSGTWLNELIWREFFKQVLYHHPHVVDQPYRAKYAMVPWRNNKQEFLAWCEGRTGYPMVDAGMRELNQTGFMHNRARMITASFLCKHLLIDWRWGERYFATRLLDYDLSANNGNWQWAAGTGCDAAPYFRIFNPQRQAERFDPKQHYIDRWLPDRYLGNYPAPIVDHKFARERTLAAYKNLPGT